MNPVKSVGDNKPDGSFAVVGIGASAGGLHSLECFLEALPQDFDFAIVFIQHLSPAHKSLMPELLRSKWRNHDFMEIEDDLQLLPGRLYLCPPAIDVRINEGTFRVIARPEDHIHFTIDEFLVSLAEDSAERAIAVIFSGAGTDGIRGIQAVSAGGGTVFVQDPDTAQFPELPRAAIKTGLVDSVLPPPDIAREIIKLLGSGKLTDTSDKLLNPAELEPFFLLLHEKTGHHFNHYKKSVIARRIRRRMNLQGIASISEYLNVIAEKPGEATLLAYDLMIGVTSFFRDRLAWKALRMGVIQKLVILDGDTPIRVWTPACATGEESYSIAMMLRHELDLAGRRRELQVFATDVNDGALEKAREGRYPASIAADIPADYLNKFFTYTEDRLELTINKELRQHVIFAKQDLLMDPPFSRLDLVICRNLLIYLEPDAQDKCITLFHYALRPGGYLFLGNAESPGRKNTLFKSLGHKKCRVYEKIETEPSSRLPLTVPFAPERTTIPSWQQTVLDQQHSIIQLSQETLLEEYAPAAVTIDQNYNILYHNGPTKRYLSQPRGATTHNLLDLVPNNIRSRIRGAIYKVTTGERPVSIIASIDCDTGQKRQVSIRLSKIKDNLLMIVFKEKESLPSEVSSELPESACVEEPAIQQLEIELSKTRQELQTNIEQLKSLNEEQHSSNEELQAANEELETSREELQSLNEELITVNAQLQSKVEEQEETNDDLNNFFGSTNIPTLFLDRRFRVRRFTAAITKLIKLIPSDVGRPIVDMSRELLGPELIADAQAVLENLVQVKKEIRIGDTWYVRTTLPYRTLDDHIEGVVVTYNDVTELKRAEERSRHLASFPQLNPNPVIEVDSSGEVIFCNSATERILESLGMDRGDVDALLPQDMDAIWRDWDKKTETTIHREIDIKERLFDETIQLVPQFNVARIYANDITERKKAEEEIVRAKEGWERTFASVPDMIAILDNQHRVVRVNESMARRLGRKPEDCAGLHCYEAVHGLPAPPSFCPHVRTLKDGTTQIEEVHEERLGGEFLVSTTPLRDEQGQMIGSVHVAHDITAQKLAESERETAVAFLRLINESRNTLELVNAATAYFHKISGCEAVGIRLREGHDYPYYETQGFPAEFVQAESRLCTCDKDGQPILDSSGDPVLACMCGNVICGRFDPSKPFFTKRGNFWTNSTTELLASTNAKARQARTRNRCNGEGYESVALIGLSLGDERLGLLQLNDKRSGRFTAESISIWERLADYLAVALAKFGVDEKLRKSEERYRNLFNTIDEGFCIIEMIFDEELRPVDYRFLEVNAAFEKQTGLHDAEGKSMRELAPAHEAHWFEIYGKIALTGEPARFVNEARALNRWYDVYAYRVGKPEDRQVAIIFNDISGHKRAEAEMLRLNKALKALSDSSQAVVHATDESEYLNEVCRIIVEDCGYSMSWIGFAEHDETKSVRPAAHAGFEDGYLETLRITWADTEHGRGPTGMAIRKGKVAVCRNILTDPAFLPWRQQAISRGYASSIVFPLHAGNKVIGALTIYSKEADPFSEGEVKLLAELADNLSNGIEVLRIRAAQKKAEDALKESEVRYRTLFETMTEGFSIDEIILDDSGKPADLRYLSVNPAFERHTGLKAKDVEGHTTRELFPEAEPVWFERYGRVALTGEPVHFEERFGPLNKWFEVSAYQTEPSCLAVVFFDVTKRKQAEQEIIRLNNDLLLRNENLEFANKELESFIYSVSHDLRGPLRHISGFADLLMKKIADKLAEKEKQYLSRIRDGSEKMSRLIDDLLNLSRISRQEINLIEVDMSSVAASIVTELREAHPNRGVNVDIEEGLTVLADRGLMEVLLSNLIGNAWKFTAKAEQAQIEIGSIKQNGNIIYYVQDNGAGFDQKYAGKMFWPFHRLHSDAEFEGTGIGLAIVDRIVRLHGGKVWAEGIEEKGATIYFSLT